MSKKTKIKQHTPSQKLRFERPEEKIRSYPAPEASHEPEPAEPSPRPQPASKNMANFANVMNATFHYIDKEIKPDKLTHLAIELKLGITRSIYSNIKKF